MITTELVLSKTPQAITVPDTGVRLQSVGGLYFKWKAAATTPTLTSPNKDSDVFIGVAGTIYVWGFVGQILVVTK